MSAVAPSPLIRRKDRLRRRKAVNRGMELLAMAAAAIGLAILAILVYKIVRNGAAALNWDLFTLGQIPDAPPGIPQGLANAFAGTLVIVGLAAAMGIPYATLVAIYLVEFAPRRVRNFISLILDVLMGVPAIVLGIFYYELLVLTTHTQRGLWGAIALATMMLPLVARSTMEVLLLVPNSLREASLGLGVPRWRTTLGVVLPQTMGGIVTGSILAVSRVAGEAAPLLFLSALGSTSVDWNPLHPLSTVPLAILGIAEGSPYPEDRARAWAAALVLMIFILVASLSARWLAARSRRKILGSAR
ncbi:MAG TPA: phosphate ABC transporter permease PstA [Gaiellaceae bacterium]|jgi:phosphate transport system permease protein